MFGARPRTPGWVPIQHVELKSERLAMAYRLLLAYAFVLPGSSKTPHTRIRNIGPTTISFRNNDQLLPLHDRRRRRRLRVGGATEIEVKERKDRVDDAVHATRAAVEEGVLPGGGVFALLRAIKALEKLKVHNDDQRTGIEIVRKALSWSARQIAINAGDDGSIVVGKILDKDTYAFGYDAQTGEYGNLVSKGIIDPTKVVRTALQDAASIAGLLITTEAMVAEVPKKQSPAMPGGPGGGMGGMDF